MITLALFSVMFGSAVAVALWDRYSVHRTIVRRVSEANRKYAAALRAFDAQRVAWFDEHFTR